jgi:hypothetical protein
MDNILVLIGTSQSSIAVPVLKESFSASLSHGHACLCSWIPKVMTMISGDDNYFAQPNWAMVEIG